MNPHWIKNTIRCVKELSPNRRCDHQLFATAQAILEPKAVGSNRIDTAWNDRFVVYVDGAVKQSGVLALARSITNDISIGLKVFPRRAES
jgi:hypothetical protein